MSSLEIRKIGPINECKIELNSLNVITGKQSSGKSTIAKCLFFFLNLKNELGRLTFLQHHQGVFGDGRGNSLGNRYKWLIKYSLEDIFSTDNSVLREDSFLRMDYTEYIYIQVSYNGNSCSISYSNKLRDFIKYLEDLDGDSSERSFRDSFQKAINDFFQLDYEPIYIPAGRSLMTVMGNQFELFYSKLNDRNKELIDLCSRSYFERVMELKPLFREGLNGVWNKGKTNNRLDHAQLLMKNVMNADYYYSKGEEYLKLKDGHRVGVNMASSGQQEALWIYNILMYYMSVSEKKFYIIEEPESNLFPESQQHITKFLGLVANFGNPMLINTHSPYVLGELNNMIYAGEIKGREKRNLANEVVEKECQLGFKSVSAFFVEDGFITDCMDRKIKQIDNTKLDAISEVINEEFDRLMEIEKGK